MSDSDYFNQLASEWDNICFHDPNKVSYIVEQLNPRPSSTVLDVGTGTGVLIPYIKSYLNESGSISAIDVSENMLKEAEKKYYGPSIHYIHGDVLEMEFEEMYDIIICYSVFPHFKDKKMKAIQKLASMLKDDGQLCIAHSQSRNAINSLHQKAGDPVKKDRLPEMKTLEKAFISNDLKVDVMIDNEEMYMIVGKHISE